MNIFKKPVADVSSSRAGSDGSDELDAPWIRAGKQYEDTFLRLGAQVKNWRRSAFGAMFLAVLAVGGLIHIGSQSKYIPMLVEVDKLGQTVAVRALTGNDAITDPNRLVYREMFDLIENLRTVTTDRAANNRNLERGFTRLDGAAKEYVRTELRKAPPNEVGATKTVQVKVKTALKLTGKSWQIEWEEHSFSLVGEEIGMEVWRATLQYDLSPSGEEKSIRTNPIGFIVPDLSWQKVL